MALSELSLENDTTSKTVCAADPDKSVIPDVKKCFKFIYFY